MTGQRGQATCRQMVKSMMEGPADFAGLQGLEDPAAEQTKAQQIGLAGWHRPGCGPIVHVQAEAPLGRTSA